MRRLLLVALASCGDSSPGESPSYEGSHVVLFSDPELGLCAGSLAAMDGFVERFAAELGVEPPTGDERYRFHWLDEEGVEAICRAPVTACAPDGVSLRRCGGCDEGDWMATWVGGTPRLAELRPGLHSLRLHGVATDAVTLGFTLSLLPGDAPMPAP